MKIGLLLLVLIGGFTAHAAALLLVNVNTTTVNPSTGVLEFQYNTLNALASNAAITDFGGAALGSVVPPSVGVTGDLTTKTT